MANLEYRVEYHDIDRTVESKELDAVVGWLVDGGLVPGDITITAYDKDVAVEL